MTVPDQDIARYAFSLFLHLLVDSPFTFLPFASDTMMPYYLCSDEPQLHGLEEEFERVVALGAMQIPLSVRRSCKMTKPGR